MAGSETAGIQRGVESLGFGIGGLFLLELRAWLTAGMRNLERVTLGQERERYQNQMQISVSGGNETKFLGRAGGTFR